MYMDSYLWIKATKGCKGAERDTGLCLSKPWGLPGLCVMEVKFLCCCVPWACVFLGKQRKQCCRKRNENLMYSVLACTSTPSNPVKNEQRN